MDQVIEIVEEVVIEEQATELTLEEMQMVGGGTVAVSLF